MWVNIFEADSFEEEAQLKVIVSLTTSDLIRELKQGEVLSTDWLPASSLDAEFRVIVQGRRVGLGKGGDIIDLRDGGPRVVIAR